MLIKFFDRGTGSGSGAVDYLTRLTDPTTKKLREPAPKVLRGGIPANTASIIDRLRIKHKYRSGVLSFAPEDKPTEKEQQQLIDDFERTAFAGIREENRNILWIRHQHTGNNRVELHFLSPRVELSSGKSLNIAPPGWRGYFYPWQRAWDLKKGWSRPDDPGRARVSSPGHKAYEERRKSDDSPKQDTRCRATAAVERAIALGKAKDRTGVLKALQDNGFEVVRATNKSITIKNQEWSGKPNANQAKVRLKSQTFYIDWTLANQINPPAIDTAAEIAKLDERLNGYFDKRVEINQGRYPLNFIPEPEIEPQPFTSLPEMMRDALGDQAIIPPGSLVKKIRAKRLKRKAQATTTKPKPSDPPPPPTNSNDELAKFKRQINLVDYAIANGFAKIERESSVKSVKLKHSDGSTIVVRPGKDDVYFSPDNSLGSGTIIDFVQQYHQINLGQARVVLRKYLAEQQQKKRQKSETKQGDRQTKKDYQTGRNVMRQGLTKFLPQIKSLAESQQGKRVVRDMFQIRNYQNLKRHKYLELQRGISHQIIQSDRFRDQLKLDDRNNATFVYRDNSQITGYELRNYDFKNFKTGGKKSLWRSNQKSTDNKLVITESPIDALSYHQLYPNSQTRYISTGGTMSPQQQELLKAQIKLMSDKMKSIIIATDNDEGGDKLADEIQSLLPSRNYLFHRRSKAKFKDWNEDLIANVEQKNQQDNQQKKKDDLSR